MVRRTGSGGNGGDYSMIVRKSGGKLACGKQAAAVQEKARPRCKNDTWGTRGGKGERAAG